MISAKTVASRIACTQLICSRWALERMRQTMVKDFGSVQDIPVSVNERLDVGLESIRQCSTLDEIENLFTTKESQFIQSERWLSDDINISKSSVKNHSSPIEATLNRYEMYWPSLNALLWSLRVIDKLSPIDLWGSQSRQESFSLTGIQPSRPASILYWIRGFDKDNLV